MAPETALIVFARAPVPGRVKTRLVPVLGRERAASLHARLVEHALRTAVAAGFDDVILCCTPAPKGRFFKAMKKQFGIRLSSQGRGDLGQRMHRALNRHPGAVLIGSDCPALRPADLRAAARALRSGLDAVFSPAEDGGYALIGTRLSARALFAGVHWGGAKVMAQTRVRLRRLGWHWKELRSVWDVDRPVDLERLRRSNLLSAKPRPTSSAARRRAAP
jgi:rSAM/selenodomain-associated transferase 1